jgi:hypothetical protein
VPTGFVLVGHKNKNNNNNNNNHNNNNNKNNNPVKIKAKTNFCQSNYQAANSPNELIQDLHIMRHK